MSTARTPATILAEIAAIPTLERGTLSPMRSRSGRTYYNLQCWRDGRNVSRYVPKALLPHVEAAVANHTRFRALVDEYAQLLERQTRQARTTPATAEGKKMGPAGARVRQRRAAATRR